MDSYGQDDGKGQLDKAMNAIIVLLFMKALVGQQGHDYTPADVEAGARYYSNYCSGCHGVDGNTMAGANLGRGTFRRAANDDELARVITNGLPGTAMPPSPFKAVQVMQIVAFLREFPSLRSRQNNPGDAVRGKQVFEGKGACLDCHRVNGHGSRLGPDLSDIGDLRRPPDLEQSLVDPAAVVLPQNRVITVSTRDGRTIRGRLLNQDTASIQMLGADEKPLSLRRDALRSIADEKFTMPSYKDRLDSREVADVVSYLISLKGFK
jgi:putative heme-binding domain-containing protein